LRRRKFVNAEDVSRTACRAADDVGEAEIEAGIAAAVRILQLRLPAQASWKDNRLQNLARWQPRASNHLKKA